MPSWVSLSDRLFIVPLLGERMCAPLLFARSAISVAVHLHSGATRQEKFGFAAGLHLRTVLASVTAEACFAAWRGGRLRFTGQRGRGRRNLSCWLCGRCLRAGFRQAILARGIQLIHCRLAGRFFWKAGAALESHSSVDHAFVDGIRGLSGH